MVAKVRADFLPRRFRTYRTSGAGCPSFLAHLCRARVPINRHCTSTKMSFHDTNVPRPEYPRPQFVRADWLNLNGVWEFGFDDADQGISMGWPLGLPLDRQIIAPFPYQSELSGINDKSVHEIIWYARDFEVPSKWKGMNVLLHFGAVDYQCTVWVNGQEVGHNRGGHTPFQFNIGPYLNLGNNRLTVRVPDTQSPAQPRGKQSVSGLPHDIDYYCTSGIWQTVWLEPVPPIRIDELNIITHAHRNLVELTIHLHAPSAPWTIRAEISEMGRPVAEAEGNTAVATGRLVISIPYAKLWSPDSPHLY